MYEDGGEIFQPKPGGARRQLEPGEVVGGRFSVSRLLGQGGMGEVYLVNHMQLHKPAALKTIPIKDQGTVARFAREAKSIAALSHPNIVTTYGAGVQDDMLYIAMEYIDGASLADALKSSPGGRFPVERALPLFLQLCDALEHAHERGIVHRDIKPSNIMLVGSPEVAKLVDFGIAKLLPQDEQTVQRLTNTMAIVGSAPYMSPEQCAGEPVDQRSDLYSLGCLMYEVLTGAPPFVGETVFAVIQKHLNEEPKPLTGIPKNVQSAILSTLQKAPADRPASAAAVKGMLLDPGARVSKRHAKLPTVSKPFILWLAVTFALAIPALVWIFSQQESHQTQAFLQEQFDQTLRHPEGGFPNEVDEYVTARRIALLADDPLRARRATARILLGRAMSQPPNHPLRAQFYSRAIAILEDLLSTERKQALSRDWIRQDSLAISQAYVMRGEDSMNRTSSKFDLDKAEADLTAAQALYMRSRAGKTCYQATALLKQLQVMRAEDAAKKP